MPITGYMKTGDPGRISSLTTLDDPNNKDRRKRLQVLRQGTEDSVYVNMYVRDCRSHKPRGAVVPVILKAYQADEGWVVLGTVKCCPLCWRILDQGDVEGLPVPLPQDKPKGLSPKQKAHLSRMRHRTKGRELPKHSPLWSIIQDFVDSQEEFTLQDIIERSGKSRTAVRTIVAEMMKKGTVKITREGGRGMASRTYYQAP